MPGRRYEDGRFIDDPNDEMAAQGTPIAPLAITVPIVGDDAELAAIGAVVYLLEQGHFPGRAPEPLTAEQKASIAQYLYQRYSGLFRDITAV